MRVNVCLPFLRGSAFEGSFGGKVPFGGDIVIRVIIVI